MQSHLFIPNNHKLSLTKEVNRLIKIGVLKKINNFQWIASTFIIPNTNCAVRFLSDSRQLNKVVKRKPFLNPKIKDSLRKLGGFRYATFLNLNIGYNLSIF